MGFGGNKDPQTTTSSTETQLSPEQQQILQLAMPGLQQWAAKTPKRYGGQTLAGFDPTQTQAQEMILGATGGMKGIADNAANTSNFWLGSGGDPWNPANNKMLSGAVDASTRPITQQLTESILPGIRSGAVAGGNFGSSRQGIAEGLASGRASQAVGDTAAKLVNENYKTNVDAQMKALGLAPQTQQLQLAPGMATGAVGDVRRAMSQAQLDELQKNFSFDQNAGYLQSRELMSLLHGIPGGKNVSTSVGAPPTTVSPWMKGLGGAASGASLGSAFGPWGTAIGAGTGGLYGLFS